MSGVIVNTVSSRIYPNIKEDDLERFLEQFKGFIESGISENLRIKITLDYIQEGKLDE